MCSWRASRYVGKSAFALAASSCSDTLSPRNAGGSPERGQIGCLNGDFMKSPDVAPEGRNREGALQCSDKIKKMHLPLLEALQSHHQLYVVIASE